MQTTNSQITASIQNHLSTLSPEARQDIAEARWDEVMTDALYAACGATTVEEMAEAKSTAEGIAFAAILSAE